MIRRTLDTFRATGAQGAWWMPLAGSVCIVLGTHLVNKYVNQRMDRLVAIADELEATQAELGRTRDELRQAAAAPAYPTVEDVDPLGVGVAAAVDE